MARPDSNRATRVSGLKTGFFAQVTTVSGLATTVTSLATTVTSLATTVTSLATTVTSLATTVTSLATSVTSLATSVSRVSEGGYNQQILNILLAGAEDSVKGRVSI
jgi:hypothetical protein